MDWSKKINVVSLDGGKLNLPSKSLLSMFLYFLVSEAIETEATKRKQNHKLDDLVSTIAMNLEKKKSHNKPLVIIKLLVSDTCNVWKKINIIRFFSHLLIFKIWILIIMPIINIYLLRLYLQMKPYILPFKKYMICQDFNEVFKYNK